MRRLEQVVIHKLNLHKGRPRSKKKSLEPNNEDVGRAKGTGDKGANIPQGMDTKNLQQQTTDGATVTSELPNVLFPPEGPKVQKVLPPSEVPDVQEMLPLAISACKSVPLNLSLKYIPKQLDRNGQKNAYKWVVLVMRKMHELLANKPENCTTGERAHNGMEITAGERACNGPNIEDVGLAKGTRDKSGNIPQGMDTKNLQQQTTEGAAVTSELPNVLFLLPVQFMVRRWNIVLNNLDETPHDANMAERLLKLRSGILKYLTSLVPIYLEIKESGRLDISKLTQKNDQLREEMINCNLGEAVANWVFFNPNLSGDFEDHLQFDAPTDREADSSTNAYLPIKTQSTPLQLRVRDCLDVKGPSGSAAGGSSGGRQQVVPGIVRPPSLMSTRKLTGSV
ncbi:unnamed protein product [Gongylonema pulchrum]|uniref:Uncharacterized protein n=1 Tax=Gongylonema pulchrum TaxID=637853 RepID=A0A183E0A1_9BILA|nr:unnamed protein product [Gongylonema pulchrum]